MCSVPILSSTFTSHSPAQLVRKLILNIILQTRQEQIHSEILTGHIPQLPPVLPSFNESKNPVEVVSYESRCSSAADVLTLLFSMQLPDVNYFPFFLFMTSWAHPGIIYLVFSSFLQL